VSYPKYTQAQTGRRICEDGTTYNIGDHFRGDFVSIARGYMPGAQVFGAYGERTTSGAEVNSIIWPNGPFNLPPASGVQMSIGSTSAEDSATGDNVRSVVLHYLDTDLAPQTETVTLNGTTSVLTTATNIRFVQDFHVLTYGVNSVSAGFISVSHNAVIYNAMTFGTNRAASSARMVPAGKVLFVDGAVASSISGTSAARTELRIVSTELYGQLYNDPFIFFPQASIGVQDGAVSYQFGGALRFSAGAVVAIAHTSDKSAVVSGSWFGWLEGAA